MDLQKFSHDEIRNLFLVCLRSLENEPPFTNQGRIELSDAARATALGADQTTQLAEELARDGLVAIEADPSGKSFLTTTEKARKFFSHFEQMPLSDLSILALRKSYDFYTRYGYDIDLQINSILIACALGVSNTNKLHSSVRHLIDKGLLRKLAILRDSISYTLTQDGVNYVEHIELQPKPIAEAEGGVSANPDPKKVFVVHGRNMAARNAMFTFLRAIGLHPIEWTEATSMAPGGSPYVGSILEAAFQQAQAIVVLFTGDDEARLRGAFSGISDPPFEKELTPQARPNVLFEAGLAFGSQPDRTVLVELGNLRPFSDIGGRHTVRIQNATERRQDLAMRLRKAGCDVNLDGTDWHSAGDFDSSIPGPA